MRLKATDDRVCIKIDPFDNQFGADSALVRPQSVQEMPLTGTVVDAGPGRWATKKVNGQVKNLNHRIPMDVKTGDRVVIPYGVGIELATTDGLFKIVRESEITGLCD